MEEKHIEVVEPVHMQAELPAAGTSLNPVETDWAFNDRAGAVPIDEAATAMQQGE